jgi:hypothetical protein
MALRDTLLTGTPASDDPVDVGGCDPLLQPRNRPPPLRWREVELGEQLGHVPLHRRLFPVGEVAENAVHERQADRHPC